MMPRNLRTLPRPGALVEISQRTIQGLYLLRPSDEVNEIVVGCLRRAQKNTAAQLHAVAVLSSHFHLLASFETTKHMSDFMRHFKANLSKEIGKIHDWSGSMYAGRYHSVPVSDEPEAQIARLRYVLAQGCKEGLVDSPFEWPGVGSAGALVLGQALEGVWVDRTALWRARQRGEEVRAADFAVRETLQLAPLPCWSHLDAAARRLEVSRLVVEIERETAAMHAEQGTRSAGARSVRRRRPRDGAKHFSPSPQPLFHAASRAVRLQLVEGLREVVRAYRSAAERLRVGELDVAFPENCFPPGLPFVEPSSG